MNATVTRIDRRRAGVLLAAALVAAAVIGLFLVDAGTAQPDPVPFDDTVPVGLTMEDRHALDQEVELPKVQVFYASYRYVVGYYGVESFANERADEHHERIFGQALAIYVTDFSGTDPDLTDEGYPTTTRPPDWIDAEGAYYVTGSEARTPAGETAVPFSDRADAERFAAQHGGEVVGWDVASEPDPDRDDVASVRESVEDRRNDADDLVADRQSLLDRPVSLVVGEDTETIQEAIDTAPENTTVVVPEGVYEETVEIDRPITLVGEGSVTIRGDETGTVVSVNADDVAVSGFSVDGVGEEIQDPEAADADPDAWDHNVELGYGHGDAGIAAIEANGTLVSDVQIDTRANGVLLRDAPEAVVRELQVNGTDEWGDGFMGVMTMRSPGVVEESKFEGGRDGVYMHRSHGMVVRDSTFEGGRFGVHLMYTSETLLTDNEGRDQELGGIVVMTGPERTAIVGNDMRGGQNGIDTSGSDAYVADNVVVDNRVGILAGAGNSVYERNAMVRNEIGMRASSIHPNDYVVGNDFVDNDQHALAAIGGLRIWTDDGQGNYWSGAPGTAVAGPTGTETLDRAFSPTDPVDEHVHRSDGARTLAESPAVTAIRELRGSVPGLQAGSVLDEAPLAEPANPELLEQAQNETV